MRVSQRPRIFIFCYHKTGSVLFSKIMSSIAQALGMRMSVAYGRVTQIDRVSDIILFAHSLIECDISKSHYRGVRVIRDPRDIWVSGYFYHRRCSEEWCTNTNFDLSAPIRFPRVPLSQQHRSEEWKKNYLNSLREKSYQQNLLELDRNAGLLFEMNRYAEWTADAMKAWNIRDHNTIDCKLESIASDFDGTMRMLFKHLGLTSKEVDIATTLAKQEDINRMDEKSLSANTHIFSKDLTRWKQTLISEQITTFQGRHGELISRLGYDLYEQ